MVSCDGGLMRWGSIVTNCHCAGRAARLLRECGVRTSPISCPRRLSQSPRRYGNCSTLELLFSDQCIEQF